MPAGRVLLIETLLKLQVLTTNLHHAGPVMS